jgi:hypothetical protein
MPNESGDTVHTLWQQQPREGTPMSMDEIRVKAERLDVKTRRWNLMTAAVFLLIIVANVLEILYEHEQLERAGSALILIAIAFLAFKYRRRAGLSETAPAMTSCVNHYRATLVRQRDIASGSWRDVLLLVPGMTLSVLGGIIEGSPLSRSVIIVFFVALFAGYFWLGVRTARRFQQEIDRLAGL